jgi:hypothetical protein
MSAAAKGPPATDASGGGSGGGIRERLRMYSLIIGSVLTFKVPRFAINTMVPFIVSDLGLPRALTPSLLAAFHPGYIATQVPTAYVVKAKGAKFVCSVMLFGSAALLALVPRASSMVVSARRYTRPRHILGEEGAGERRVASRVL